MTALIDLSERIDARADVDTRAAAAAWLARRLARSFEESNGAEFSAAEWAWLEVCFAAVADALRQSLGVPVRVSASDFDTPWNEPAALVVCGRCGDSGPAWQLELDGRAARLLADAVGVRLVRRRGFGALLEAERGLAEFAILDAADRIVQTLDPHAAFVITALGDSRAAEAAHTPDTRALGIELRIGASEGRVRLRLTGRNPDATFPSADLARRLQLSDELHDARLSAEIWLAPVELTRIERDAISTGDVLLTGWSDFRDVPAAVVSGRGWELCSAQLDAYEPTYLSVRVGPLRPRAAAIRLAAACGGSVPLWPVLGHRAIPTEQLTEWPTGGRMRFLSTAQIEVRGADRWRARCEPVRVGDEVGLRVLELGLEPGANTEVGAFSERFDAD